MWCGVVWCGVVWCGVEWSGVVWCGVVWCGVVWCGVVACGCLQEAQMSLPGCIMDQFMAAYQSAARWVSPPSIELWPILIRFLSSLFARAGVSSVWWATCLSQRTVIVLRMWLWSKRPY